MGHSGGSPHALACAALLADRVTATVAVSGLAPYDAEGLDWYAGMADAGVGSHRAAERGRAAREAFEEAGEELDIGFTPGDEEALGGRWSWFLDVVRPAIAAGPAAAIEDDLAAVAPWDFDPADIATPVLVVHGEADRMVPVAHGRWLAGDDPGRGAVGAPRRRSHHGDGRRRGRPRLAQPGRWLTSASQVRSMSASVVCQEPTAIRSAVRPSTLVWERYAAPDALTASISAMVALVRRRRPGRPPARAPAR